MLVDILCPDSFGSNCYLVSSGRHAMIVDPSVSLAAVGEALQRRGAVPEGILLTHGHFDHMLSMDELRDAYPDIQVYLHTADADFPGSAVKNAHRLFFGLPRTWRPADHLLIDGEWVLIGEEKLQVIHTPGHTPGSVCFHGEGFLLSGDTLFAHGIGRCDLPGGNRAALSASLERLRQLPPSLTLYPGHGDTALLGDALAEVCGTDEWNR